MNNILNKLSNLPYFKTSHIEAFFPNIKKESIYKKITRWRERGKIFRLKKGFYVTREYKMENSHKLYYMYYLANILRFPSYVSGTFVLDNRGVLIDVTYPITSITTKTTRKYRNDLGRFTYHSISPKLYTGYERFLYNDTPVYVATLPKALFDYFYIKYFKVKVSADVIIRRERLDLDMFTKKDIKEFAKYCKISKNKVLIELSTKIFNNPAML